MGVNDLMCDLEEMYIHIYRKTRISCGAKFSWMLKLLLVRSENFLYATSHNLSGNGRY